MIIKPETGISGVYLLRYTPNGWVYIGSSGRCVGNRLSWHLSALRGGYHGSPKIMECWQNSVIVDWEFEILEECSKDICREREAFWCTQFDFLMNEKIEGEKTIHSPALKQKMREGRARFLETPGAREDLSRRAIIQHQERRFGY